MTQLLRQLFISSLLALGSFSAAFASVPGRIALVQYNADRHFGQYDLNRANLQQFATTAIQSGAQIIVFPEGSTYGYVDATSGTKWCRSAGPGCKDVQPVAEKIPGGRTETLWTALAKEKGVYILFNLPEVDSSGTYYNTTGISGPQGYVGKYRKRELYVTDTYYASAGTEPMTLATPYGNFGIAICMDGTYPGIFEDYSAAGVDGVIIPMDWDDSPDGPSRAVNWFAKRAREAKIDVFVSDVSTWDGTGFYPKSGAARQRDGLATLAIGVDGISYSDLRY